MLSSTSCIH